MKGAMLRAEPSRSRCSAMLRASRSRCRCFFGYLGIASTT